ncbi:retrovirus-related pol polyprotein from transposon TNT 1-94 [Tanacetum coccineum]
MVAEVPQTFEYRGGQLNAASVLKVENFTNWKKRFMCHIIGIEPQFENIIKNGPFIPMVAGQRKPEGQWTRDVIKAANLDQRLKSLIMSVLPYDQMNSIINCLTAKSTWDDMLLYHEVPSNVKESRVMDLKLCYNTFKFKEDTGFINGIPNKWLSICRSLKNTNHVKDSELASLFGKLKYEENLIDSIYETEKNKSLVSATPLGYKKQYDLEEEYQARALLAKSKRFFKKGTQRFSSAKATDQTECHKCGKKGHFTRDYWSKTSVPSYELPFQLKPLSSSQYKPELRPTKDFEAKYNKDEEEVSLDDNEMVEVKVLMALAKDNNAISKKGARNDEYVKISMRKVLTLLEMEDNDDRKTYLDYLCIDLHYVEEQRNNLLSKHRDLVHELNTCKEQNRTERELTSITKAWLNSSDKVIWCISKQIPSQKKRILGVDQLTKGPSTSGKKNYHDSGRILPAESQRNTTDPSVAVTDSLVIEYDLADESSVCSTPLPPLKKLDGTKPVSGSKTIKLILKSKSTFKDETIKGVIINEPSSTPAKGNKSFPASKFNFALVGKLKSVKIKDDPPLAIVIKELNDLKLQISKTQSSYSRNNQRQQYDIKKPIWYLDSRCSRHITGVKSYLHKYVEQPRPKVMFGDDSTCTTEGYGSIKCNDIVFTKFDEKRGTIFNSNKEVVMIALRFKDVYILDMTSSTQESCFFAKASDNLNWLWHKRLAHLNFKIINKLAKQNLVIGLSLLVYSKDKPCSLCEKGKHHRASFKRK